MPFSPSPMAINYQRRLEESDDGTPSMSSNVLKSTFRIYGSTFLVLFTVFCFLRQRYRRLFNIRSWVPELKCDLAMDQHGFIRWVWELYYIPDVEILDQYGMDALCFLRIIRFGFRLSLLSIFNSLWLMPIYATAPVSSETANIVDRMEKLSTSHLPSGSHRFFATVVAAYILFLYSMYLILQEFEWYTRHRHHFLSRRTVRNYAVYVSGIPDEYRSSYALTDFFRECFSRDAVFEAHVALEIPELERKVATREALVIKLEHAVNVELHTGVTPKHRSVDLCKGEVEMKDTIEGCEIELVKLNDDILRSIKKIEAVNDRFRSQLKKYRTKSDLSNEIAWSNADCSRGDFSLDASSRRFELFPIIDETEANGQDLVIGVNTEEVPQVYNDMEKGDQGEGGVTLDVLDKHDASGVGIFDDSPRSQVNSGARTASPENVPSDDDTGAKFIENSIGAQLPPPTQEVEPVPSDGGSLDIDPFKASTIPTSDANSGPFQAQVVESDVTHHNDKVGLDQSTLKSFGDGHIIMNDSDSIQLSQMSHVSNTMHGDIEEQDGLKRWATTETSSLSVWTTTSNLSETSGRLGKLSVSGFSEIHKDVTRVAKSGSKVAKKAVKGSKHHVSKAIKGVNQENIMKVTDYGLKNIKRAGSAGLESVAKVKDVGVENVKQLAAFVLGEGEGKPRDAGFVVFTKLSTTHAALQMIHHPTPFVMNVEEAPEPDDIYWKNVGMPHKARQIGRLSSLGLSTALCLFWTIPISFISSLAHVNSLQETVPFLKTWVERSPWIEPILQQIAPLLLLLLNQLLPGILTEISKLEGHVAATALEASLFFKLAAFMIIQTFFVSAITGGIVAEIENILESPEQVIDLLANSLPAKSTYFVQIVLVNTFIGQGLGLLRVFPLLKAWIRTKVGPNLTEDERNTRFMFFRPLTDPPEFQHAQVLSQIILFIMVVFVYSTMAPVTSYFVAFCWLVLGSGYRHQFIYNYPKTPDSGGKLWSKFIGIVLICMLIAQLTLIGLLVLKKVAVATPFLIPLPICTILFNFYIGIRHFYVTNHLPTRECLQLDRINHMNGGIDFEFLLGKYIQPALQSKSKTLYPRNLDSKTSRLSAT